jgi:hypothetical protein
MAFMKLNPEKMHNDYYISKPLEKPATRYFNPRHFQIQWFMERCDLVVIVEHCSLCDTHTHLLRHDGRKYDYEANKCLQQLSKMIHDGYYHLRLGVVKVPVLPLEYTVGCFEVSLIYQNKAGQYYNKLIYSKKATKTWPTAEDLEIKLNDFVRNAKVQSHRSSDVNPAYSAEDIAGISKTPFPVGGLGPWEATPYGRIPAVVYPSSQTLLAATITESDVLWVYDSRIDDTCAMVPTQGTVVWIRSLPACGVPGTDHSNVTGKYERHSQIGVVVATVLSPRTSTSSVTSVAMLQVRLKYDTGTRPITVPANLCMSDVEYIVGNPLSLDCLPLELETLFLLAYIYADRLPRNDTFLPLITELKLSSTGNQQEELQSLFFGWKLLSATDSCKDGKISLSRTSVYHGIRELAAYIESFLLVEGKISAENNFCVGHRGTMQRIDLQLAYSEPVLDWIFANFEASSTVNVIDLNWFVLLNYQQSERADALPNSVGFARNSDSPVCGISMPEINIEKLISDNCDLYDLCMVHSNASPAIPPPELGALQQLMQLVAPLFRFVLSQVCIHIYLVKLDMHRADDIRQRYCSAAGCFSDELVLKLCQTGDLHASLVVLQDYLSNLNQRYSEQIINKKLFPVELIIDFVRRLCVPEKYAKVLEHLDDISRLLQYCIGTFP